ncbi:MAG: hypothetical protein WC456_04110 [Patescibacteria group bacterium]
MSEEKNIKISEETQIDLPPGRKFLPVDYKDWNRIKKNIENINFRSGNWENAGWSMLTMAATLAIAVSTSDLKYEEYFISAIIGSLILMVLCAFVAHTFNSSNSDGKASVIKDMSEIEQEIRRSEVAGDKKLNIIKALYGIDGAEFDISEELRKKISNESLELKIDNDIKGDPSKGSAKRAIIEYSIFGEIKTIEVKEGDSVKIP